MTNEAIISLNGYVATQPQLRDTRNGTKQLKMRVAWTPRRFDQATNEWKDGQTSFLTVYAYRRTAENAAACMRKGDPVVVHGRVTIREYEDQNGIRRSTMEVDAASLGHDLNRGVSMFQRVRPQTGLTALQYGAMDGSLGGSGSDDEAFASLAAAAGLDDHNVISLADAARDRADVLDDPDSSDASGPDDDGSDQDALAQETAAAAVPF
jgi:single-strand DNA-binding protein